MSHQAAFDLSLAQVREPIFVQLSDGRIQNGYEIKVNNKTNRRLMLRFRAEGLPAGAELDFGRFLRSSNSRDDFDFAMSESAPGEYRAKLQMPLHGVWDLVLRIRRGADVHEIRAETSVEPGKGQRQ